MTKTTNIEKQTIFSARPNPTKSREEALHRLVGIALFLLSVVRHFVQNKLWRRLFPSHIGPRYVRSWMCIRCGYCCCFCCCLYVHVYACMSSASFLFVHADFETPTGHAFFHRHHILSYFWNCSCFTSAFAYAHTFVAPLWVSLCSPSRYHFLLQRHNFYFVFIYFISLESCRMCLLLMCFCLIIIIIIVSCCYCPKAREPFTSQFYAIISMCSHIFCAMFRAPVAVTLRFSLCTRVCD